MMAVGRLLVTSCRGSPVSGLVSTGADSVASVVGGTVVSGGAVVSGTVVVGTVVGAVVSAGLLPQAHSIRLRARISASILFMVFHSFPMPEGIFGKSYYSTQKRWLQLKNADPGRMVWW